MGPQNLYDLTVQLADEKNNLLDRQTKRIGLRTLTLQCKNDKTGQSFQFVANGMPFFAKGANWIPADTFITSVTDARYKKLLKDAADANMNMLRVWGGGVYENDIFYDICDRLGICIWQDFMFACAAYPAFDKSFVQNVKAEARDNIKRLRHHPCMALWCGNNELEMDLFERGSSRELMDPKQYGKLFDSLLKNAVGKFDTQRQFWPSSPHTPKGKRTDFNSPDSGDAHIWDVWHHSKPFEFFHTCRHRFVSEFGFQSLPEPETIKAFTKPVDRNISSPVMEFHQRSPDGNKKIISYLLDWFRMPKNFDMTCYLTQILQADGIKLAVEHFRRNMPQTMGTLYWQLNDCWPVISWSSIDYFARKKALHYFAKRFFSSLLISACADEKTGKAKIYATSDLRQKTSAKINWTLTNLDGKIIDQDVTKIMIPPRRSKQAATLNLARYITQFGADNLLLWLKLSAGIKVVSQNLVTFTKPKNLKLTKPQISYSVTSAKKGVFNLTLKSKRPALYTWLELAGRDADFSDNYVHLYPNQPQKISVKPHESVTKSEFAKKLQIRTIVDTYRGIYEYARSPGRN